MDKKIEKELKEARNMLQDEFHTLIEDGQLMGMRNMRMGFKAWVEKFKEKYPDQNITPEQVGIFMDSYIEEFEKTINERRNGKSS